VPIGQFSEAMHEEVDHPLNDEGQYEDEDQLRQFMLGKVDELVVPSSFERLDVVFIWSACLLDKGSKEENDGVPRLIWSATLQIA
jgi:hypothetical protein